MDTVACLHLLASKILIQVIDELDLFTSFSAWLRYEIDRLASDDSSSMPDDTAEKESSIDHSKVLLYLQKVMMTSPLRLFLDDSEGETSFNQESGTLLFDALNKQIQKQERGFSYNKSLLKVDLFCRLLTQQASAVFFQIAGTSDCLYRPGTCSGMRAVQNPELQNMSPVQRYASGPRLLTWKCKIQANMVNRSREEECTLW